MPPRAAAGEGLLTLGGVAIGILIFIGLLSYHAIYLIPYPSSCVGIGCPTLTPDQAAYQNTVRVLAGVGLGVLDFAVALSVVVAFLVNAGRGDLPESTRRSISLFATVFLAIWLIFGMFFLGSFLSLFIRYY